MFHHGHSDCVCPDLELPGHPEHQHCQPGCKSSMPTLAELDEQARKDAEMKLELLNMQVQQALAAVKGGKK